MGTRPPKALLLLLLLRLLPPRGASAGSLQSPAREGPEQVEAAVDQPSEGGEKVRARVSLRPPRPRAGLSESFQGRWGLGAHNFCRNPDGDVQPWCYVAETEEGIYWRYCDIPTCHMPGYLGCFVDSGAPPALSGPSGTSTKLTVQVCLRFCRMKGYQLAGVEAGYACFCGSESDLARGRPAPATDCDQICFGHPGQLCGGDGRLGIYEGEEWAGMRGLGEGKSDRGSYLEREGMGVWGSRERNCLRTRLEEGTNGLIRRGWTRGRNCLRLEEGTNGLIRTGWTGPEEGTNLAELRMEEGPAIRAKREKGRGFYIEPRPRLQDADADPAPLEGSTQTPAVPLDGANVSCSPGPGGPEASMGAQVFSTVTAVSVLLLLVLSLLRLLRGRGCLLAPGKGSPTLGPSRDPTRSWAVWYRRPRGVALPCPPGDPQVEGLTASYRPLSASSQSSLRSLISAL
ncbi:Kremen protein 2 [Bos mutus]|uniref:Kremen protein 2 n=1 Tax=Bos mutus TaxID=72004 RepID=L8J2I7_9CETA|nr:Kremen protein 2 [Bos mutus]